MWYFCKYKDVLGIPKTGLHSYRVFNIAVMDVVFTFLFAKFIQVYIMKETDYLLILFFSFISGIILHRIFCVRTTIDKLLFP
jgi:hypothetical protein